MIPMPATVPPTASPSTLALAAYLVLTGVAAGGLGVAILVGWVGRNEDHDVVRPALWLAAPVACLGIVAVAIDRSSSRWSVESFGAWLQARSIDGLLRAVAPWWDVVAFVVLGGLVAALAYWGGWPGHRRRAGVVRWVRRLVEALACGAAVVLASGIGVKDGPWLSAVRPDAAWIAPLLLGNAASMGLAGLILVARARGWESQPSVARLERVDRGALIVQGICLAGLAVALGRPAWEVLTSWPAVVIPTFVVPVGWVLPVLLRGLAGPPGSVVAATLVLLGGTALRIALIAAG